MKTFFWSLIVFAYFLTGAILYIQGFAPDLATKSEFLKILYILFFWPVDKIPLWLAR